MNLLIKKITFLMGLLLSYSIQAEPCPGIGKVSYCDASSGRYILENGDYSTCYCNLPPSGPLYISNGGTITYGSRAVMDLQTVAGCCLWHGGVLRLCTNSQVICNDGSVSDVCSPLTQMRRSCL